MQKAGNLWVPDADWYFGHYFSTIGDCFEESGLRAGLKHVKRFRTAVDGGAHVGSWTRKLAERFQTVKAFEPQRDNYECLVANTQDRGNVTLHCTALGAEDSGTVLESGNNSGCWHLNDRTDVVDVIVEPLDGYLLGDVDYLKLDVEGYEYFALKGAEQTIAASHPVVQIEEKKLPHSYDAPMTARQLLESWGYKEVGRMFRDVVFTHGA